MEDQIFFSFPPIKLECRQKKIISQKCSLIFSLYIFYYISLFIKNESKKISLRVCYISKT